MQDPSAGVPKLKRTLADGRSETETDSATGKKLARLSAAAETTSTTPSALLPAPDDQASYEHSRRDAVIRWIDDLSAVSAEVAGADTRSDAYAAPQHRTARTADDFNMPTLDDLFAGTYPVPAVATSSNNLFLGKSADSVDELTVEQLFVGFENIIKPHDFLDLMEAGEERRVVSKDNEDRVQPQTGHTDGSANVSTHFDALAKKQKAEGARRITAEDIHRWDDTPYSQQQAAGGVKQWLAKNGIRPDDSRYLTKTGISLAGQIYLGKLTGEQGTPITREQIGIWHDMPQDRKDALGGWRGFAGQQGIALVSAKPILSNTGIYPGGYASLLKGQGRSMSTTDVAAWAALSAEQKKAAGGWMQWASTQGIELASARNLLTNKGFTPAGESKLTVRADSPRITRVRASAAVMDAGTSSDGARERPQDTGSSITREQIARWRNMSLEQKKAAGGMKGYAAEQGIALGSASAKLTNKGLTQAGHVVLSKGQGRSMEAKDLAVWNAMSDAEKQAAGGWKRWAEGEGIGLGSAMALISNKGLSSRGEAKLALSLRHDTSEPNVQARPRLRAILPKGSQAAVDAIPSENLHGADQSFGGSEGAVPSRQHPTQTVGSQERLFLPAFLDFDPSASAGAAFKPDEQQVSADAGPLPSPATGNSPDRSVSLPALHSVDSLAVPIFLDVEPIASPMPVSNPGGVSESTEPNTEQRVEEPLANKRGATTTPAVTDIFNLLSGRSYSSAHVVESDENTLAFAKSNNLIDDKGALTPEGIRRLGSLESEKNLLNALNEMKEHAAETVRMNNRQKKAFIYKLVSASNISQDVLNQYINDSKKLDAAIEEIKLKWSNQ